MTKHTFLLIISAFAMLMLGACKKETTADVSKVTVYPVFTMTGERYISIVKGGVFTEPGIVAKESGNDLQVATAGNVDVNTVGIYEIVYSATNKDGFEGTETRTVAVLPSAEQAGVNIAGSYVYITNTSFVSTITRLAEGFYLTDNVWGPNSIPSYIITVNGTDLTLPLNALSGFGDVQGTGTLDPAGNLTYKIDLLDYGIAGSNRRWRRQ